MKKIFVFVLALCIALCSVGAFATEAATPVINWADVEAQIVEAGWEGEFYHFEQFAAKMWIPSTLKAYELTEEDLANDYVAYFTNEDETVGVGVLYYDAQGVTLDELMASLPEQGATNVEHGLVNGLDVVTYSDAENNTASMIVTSDTGYYVDVIFSPMSDEGFASVAAIMMASLQAVEVAE